MKYNEIMEKVEVTDEMRERILTNVSSKAVQREKKILSFLNWKSLSALAACAAIVLLCVTALPSILNPDRSMEGDLVSTNGIIECEDIEELTKYAGFSINELTGIPFEMSECTYTWWFDTTAQIEYVGADNVITYRIAESDEDISGDYNDYRQIQEEILCNNKVTIKGDGDKVYLAIWTIGKYSYSISFSEGTSYKEMTAILEPLMGK